jgi:hypothetical protein
VVAVSIVLEVLLGIFLVMWIVEHTVGWIAFVVGP